MSILSTKIIVLCVLHKTFPFILDEYCEAPNIFWCFNFHVLILFWKYPVLSGLPADEYLLSPPAAVAPSHATILRHVRLCNTELLESLPMNPKQKSTRVKSSDAGGKHEVSERLSWTCMKGNTCQDVKSLFRCYSKAGCF